MALSSMTGFARASDDYEGWTWSWELKSVNAKGLDIRLRAPMGFDGLEPAARANLAKQFSRGNISAGLQLNKVGVGSGYRINEAHLHTLIEAARKLGDSVIDAAAPTIDGLLGLRGVIEAEEDDVDDDVRDALEAALLRSLGDAAKALQNARGEEGSRLEQVLFGFIDTIDDLQSQAAATAETQGAAIRKRLKEQVEALLSDVSGLDPARLEQEVALLMTKADIREELDRLGAHIASVRELMKSGGAIGRRLDFLCQELNREANTICSKAHETALTRIGLDMKATIEQFREQVQNIE